MTPAGPAAPRRIRVWDLPTRLFHWLLVACIVGSLVSVNLGGNAVGWHFRFGYAILTLLLFRLLWGFVGPRYARFASFPLSPSAAIAWLRGSRAPTPGHSPLGALSVYAMLVALVVQIGTGLFATDDIMWDGPLKVLVSNAASTALTRVHRINRFVVIGLVLLHVAAILWYVRVRRQALVRPMIVGDMTVDAGNGPQPPAAADGPREWLLALALLGLSAAAVWAIVTRLA
ncbi:MAG: cytochrome b/b6 domain-containing protein [Burkholderiaceae bacterium]|nr:cytochrome b/b6 domain-containing protein [Burkholderiaceae bacterium]